MNDRNNNEPRRLQKPVDYDQLYPGRFLKAGEFLGKKQGFTISDVDLEELVGDDGKPKVKCILSFEETEKKLVTCKTNGICLKEMFGKKLPDWIGKRIVLFPDVWNGEPAIRVWGSPDIERDIDVEVVLPRRRPFRKTMRAVTARQGGSGRQERPAQRRDAEADAPPDDVREDFK